MLVMFLLWIILVLLLIRVKWGKAVALLLVGRHWLRLDGRHGDLLHLWL